MQEMWWRIYKVQPLLKLMISSYNQIMHIITLHIYETIMFASATQFYN